MSSVMVNVIYRQKWGFRILSAKTVTVAGCKNVCAKGMFCERECPGMPRDCTAEQCFEDRSPMTSILAATRLDDI